MRSGIADLPLHGGRGGRTVFDDTQGAINQPAGKSKGAINPQTSFGGAWLRSESRPSVPTKRARKSGEDARGEDARGQDARNEDAQLSLFGLGAELNRAAR